MPALSLANCWSVQQLWAQLTFHDSHVHSVYRHGQLTTRTCSDACVVLGKPLVSAAAVGTDGQLTVYNTGDDGECCGWSVLAFSPCLTESLACGFLFPFFKGRALSCPRKGKEHEMQLKLGFPLIVSSCSPMFYLLCNTLLQVHVP